MDHRTKVVSTKISKKTSSKENQSDNVILDAIVDKPQESSEFKDILDSIDFWLSNDELSSDLVQKMVSAAPMVQTVSSSSTSTVYLLKISKYLVALLSEKHLTIIQSVLNNEKINILLMTLLKTTIAVYNSISNEEESSIIARKIEMMAKALVVCKTFPKVSSALGTFQTHLVYSIFLVFTKSHLTQNSPEVVRSISGSIKCILENPLHVSELRNLVLSESLKQFHRNMITNASLPSINSDMLEDFVGSLYDNSEQFASVVMRLYISTYALWTKNKQLELQSKDTTRLQDILAKEESNCWSLRISTLLAMRYHCAVKEQLRESNSVNVDNITSIDYSSSAISKPLLTKAFTYFDKAIDAIKTIAKSVQPLIEEELIVVCLDCRTLSQLTSLQGRSHYPLLKYVYYIERKLKAIGGPLLARYGVSLSTIVSELRLSCKQSFVFAGLNSSYDMQVYFACFEMQKEAIPNSSSSNLADLTSASSLADCSNNVEIFVSSCVHLLNCDKSVYAAADRIKSYEMCQLCDLGIESIKKLVDKYLEAIAANSSVNEKRSRDVLYAAVCLSLSKVAMFCFGECHLAFEYASKALNKVGNRVGCEFQIFHFESLLSLIELFDQTGSVDLCEMHVAELSVATAEFPSLTWHNIVAFQLLRIWYRYGSTCVKNVWNDLLTNSFKEDEASGCICSASSTVQRIVGGHSLEGVKVSAYRYSELLWVLSADQGDKFRDQFHSFLPANQRIKLNEFVSRHLSEASNTIIANIEASNATEFSEENLIELLRSHNFDLTRLVRRSLSVDHLKAGAKGSFAAFVAGASSCCPSVECALDSKYINAAIANRMQNWSNSITNVIVSNLESEHSNCVKARLNDILQHSSANNSSSLCFVVKDSLSNKLILGRHDSRCQLVVALPAEVKAKLEAIVDQFNEVLRDYKQISKDGSSSKTKQSTVNHKRSSKVIDVYNSCLEKIVEDIHIALGPWKILLCGRTKESSIVRSLAKELSTAESKSKKKGKGVDSNQTSELFKSQCKDWLEFVVHNTSSESCSDMLNPPEARELLNTLIQCWDPSQSDSLSIADGILLENGFVASNVNSQKGKSNSKLKTKTSHDSTVLLQNQAANLILLLDETLQSLPWESIPCLSGTATTRTPNLALLLANPYIRATAECEEVRKVSIQKSWVAIDTLGDLKKTQNEVSPFFQPYLAKWEWPSCSGEMPSKSNIRKWHEESNLFVYCGHGSGDSISNVKIRSFAGCPSSMLWGCSSGRLTVNGVFDPNGAPLHYLLGGANFAIGNLWDVTSSDEDKLSLEFMRQTLPSVENYEEEGNTVDIASALLSVRKVCSRATAVNGYAPVVYGICQKLEQ